MIATGHVIRTAKLEQKNQNRHNRKIDPFFVETLLMVVMAMTLVFVFYIMVMLENIK